MSYAELHGVEADYYVFSKLLIIQCQTNPLTDTIDEESKIKTLS